MHSKWLQYRKNLAKVLVVSLVLVTLNPLSASAAQITARKLTLGSSTVSVSTTYAFNFTVPSATAVQSFQAQVCTTASGACTTPTGFSNAASTLNSVTGLPGTWTVSNATAGSLRASTTNAVALTNPVTVVFGSVTNPSTTNTAYYARLTTYSDTAWTTAIDTGTVAASTATQIVVTGTMDESLVFCTGITITGQNCATVAGNTVNLGTFSTSAAVRNTSVMAASTNAASGYIITISGTTPTCAGCAGTPSITAMGTQSANGAATTSSVGTSQFGLNLRLNTSLGGADVTGTGTGTYGTNYGVVDNFRFFSGDTVSSAAVATNANTFTVNYIVNVPGSQAAGSYSTNLTYICTATF